MTLLYQSFHFYLRFASPVYADVSPLFVLRSMMGKNLHSMCCVSHKSKCAECMYNSTCAYSFLFETILDKKNSVVSGRDRASHPFSFTKGSMKSGVMLSEYDFEITLFGKAIEYLPYIYAAFVRSGKGGLFKNRVSFEIVDVASNGKSIFIDENHIDTNITPSEIVLNDCTSCSACEEEKHNEEILIELKSPLRFKSSGKYSTNFSAQDFMSCIFRRVKTLCSLYGTGGDEKYFPSEAICISERNLHWNDSLHYSSRQKKAMKLGGSEGSFHLKGEFSSFEKSLLESARLCSVGKNTNFGLGQIDFWLKQEK